MCLQDPNASVRKEKTISFEHYPTYSKNKSIRIQYSWMTENLNVSKFRNGDSIPFKKSIKDWKEAINNETPAWCYPIDTSGMPIKNRKSYIIGMRLVTQGGLLHMVGR